MGIAPQARKIEGIAPQAPKMSTQAMAVGGGSFLPEKLHLRHGRSRGRGRGGGVKTEPDFQGKNRGGGQNRPDGITVT